MECSAKTGIGISEVFETAIDLINKKTASPIATPKYSKSKSIISVTIKVDKTTNSLSKNMSINLNDTVENTTKILKETFKDAIKVDVDSPEFYFFISSRGLLLHPEKTLASYSIDYGSDLYLSFTCIQDRLQLFGHDYQFLSYISNAIVEIFFEIPLSMTEVWIEICVIYVDSNYFFVYLQF